MEHDMTVDYFSLMHNEREIAISERSPVFIIYCVIWLYGPYFLQQLR